MKKPLLYTALFAAVLFSGCATSTQSLNPYGKTACTASGLGGKSYYNVQLSYNGIVDEAVASILASPMNAETNPNRLKAGDALIVTDFVDTNSLENQTKLGYVLSNSLKNSLTTKHSFKVIEAEVSKYFKLSGNGLKILTRNHKNIRQTELPVERVLAGTYTYTEEELVIFAKLINLKTGIIEGSYAKSFPMTCAAMEMLK